MLPRDRGFVAKGTQRLPHRRPRPSTAAARILVVDDEPHIRQFLRAALEEEGYDVREAADGIEALAVARVWRPDAIVLDMLMPAMNGWQFAETYRHQGADAHTAPIIAITAAGPG